jgi:hypothetical protein
MLELGDGRSLVDGRGDKHVRSRCFTRPELIAVIEQQGLRVVATAGVSGLSLVLGYLRGAGQLGENAATRTTDVRALLDRLGRSGSFVRAHIVVAEHAQASD